MERGQKDSSHSRSSQVVVPPDWRFEVVEFSRSIKWILIDDGVGENGWGCSLSGKLVGSSGVFSGAGAVGGVESNQLLESTPFIDFHCSPPPPSPATTISSCSLPAARRRRKRRRRCSISDLASRSYLDVFQHRDGISS